MLLDQIEEHRAKLAGSAVEEIIIKIPKNTNRVKWWARHLTGAAISNHLYSRLDAKTTSGDFSADLSGTPLFSIDGGAAGTSSVSENTAQMAANRLKWVVQAQAGANTQFFLRVCFYDV